MRKVVFSLALSFFLFSAAVLSAQTVTKPFNGKNLDGWKAVKQDEKQFFWMVGDVKVSDKDPRSLVFSWVADDQEGVLVNLAGPGWGKDAKQRGIDFYTEKTFGDCTLEIEFMVPKGSNSGIYLMGEYEVQTCDSWGKTGTLGQGDLGAIYSAAAPKLNAAKEPGEWQKFVIEFQAPRFDADGKKIKDAHFVKVTLNGQVVQENVDVTKGSTGGGITGKEAPKGPLMLQGNHGPVAYRNIVITEK